MAGFRILLVVFVSLICATMAVNGKCRALAMSGGGNKGAYEAAVYSTLANLLPNEDLTYDVITGVSAGAFNTLALSIFEPHQVDEAADFVLALWSSVVHNDVFADWPLGIIQGVFKEKGIFDVTPGKKWVTDQIQDNTVKRKVSFAATDANSADYFVIDYNATFTQPDDLIESVFASGALPAIFEQVNRGDKSLIDGGCIWNIDIPTAIRRCKELGYEEKDMIVDTIFCTNHEMNKAHGLIDYSTLQHLFRGLEIKDFYNGMEDYNSSMALYPEVDFRYLIAPSEELSDAFIALDFSQAQIDRCFEIGEKDAKNAVKLGAGGYAQVLLDFVEKRRSKQKVKLTDLIDAKLAEIEADKGKASF